MTVAAVEKESAGRLFGEYGVAILLAVVIAMVIRFFVLEAYRIPSGAMRPALESGDTIFVSKSSYGWGRASRLPSRGDVIVFAGTEDPDRDFVKRVVALGGERVQIKSGRLWVNGREVGQSLVRGACGLEHGLYEVCWEPPLLTDVAELKVPDDSVYVLGDLRSRAGETRMNRVHGNGIVPLRLVKGKALWIWLSIEPRSQRPDSSSGWFSRIRFERMFRRIK